MSEITDQSRKESSPESELRLQRGPGVFCCLSDFLQSTRQSISAALGRQIRRMKSDYNCALLSLSCCC